MQLLGSSWAPLITALVGAMIGAALTFVFAIPLVRKQINAARSISRDQIEAARQLAEEEGSLRQPQLCAYLGHPELQDITVLTVDIAEDQPFVIEMPIVIENMGQRAAKGVSIFVKLPALCGCFSAMESVSEEVASFLGVRMQLMREESDSTIIAFSIDSLPVSVPRRLILPVAFPLDSLHRLSTRVKSADDVEVEVHGFLVHSYPISIFVADEDGQTVTVPRSIHIVRGIGRDARNYLDEISKNAEQNQSEKPGIQTPVSVAILVEVEGSVITDEVPVFGFEGGWIHGGNCRDGRYWIPSLGTSRYGQRLYPENVDLDCEITRYPPQVTFADGEVAAPHLRIELELESIFLMLKRFKDWDELTADMTPRVHARLVQLLEVYPYDRAIHELGDIQRRLLEEMTPEYARRGVRLKTLEIGCLVRQVA